MLHLFVTTMNSFKINYTIIEQPDEARVMIKKYITQ